MQIKHFLGGIFSNGLFKNSLNLMVSSGLTAVFGFVFWIVIARNFDAHAVGVAGTLLSMSTLLSLLGMVGFDTIFIRFLAAIRQKNELITGGILASIVASAFIAALFCMALPVLSPDLSFLSDSVGYVLAFIFFTVLSSLTAITNAVFIAYRRTKFVLFVGLLFGAVKLALPFVITDGSAMTIFIIVGIAQVINVVLNMIFLMTSFGFRPRISLEPIKEVFRYGMAAYASNILNLLPSSLLPIIVVNTLGTSQAAYFYIAFAIATLLYTIAYATNQVLLAEASQGLERLSHYVRRGVKMISTLMLPAITLLLLLCPILLGLFGSDYQQNATGILRVLCLNGIFVLANSIINFTFKLNKNLKAMLCMTAVNAITTVVLAQILAYSHGLVGVAIGSMLGSFLALITGCIFLFQAAKIKTGVSAFSGATQ